MSKIAVNEITDEQGSGRPSFTNGVQTSNINGGQIGGRRNLIINGAMQVAQRGTSSTATSFGYNSVDRFAVNPVTGTATQSQESDGPSGVAKHSFKVLATDTQSLEAGDDSWIRYIVETKDIEHLDLTSSNTKLTLSFYVKCSTTGQSSVAITSGAFSSAKYVHPFTISAADTWQKVTHTFGLDSNFGVSGDRGLRLYWDIGLGSSYQTSSTNQWITSADIAASGNIQILGVNNRYLQITGVQLEVGDAATEFEHRSYGEELALCERYYQISDTGLELDANASFNYGVFAKLAPKMRVSPSVSSVQTINSSFSFTGVGNRTISQNGFDVRFSSTSNENASPAYFRCFADAEL